MAAPRVRFAPAPTGTLHVGNARSALFNWLYARHHGGTFILRVEDTDPERSRDEFVASLVDVLSWLGLDWDEGPGVGGEHGPYRQSERLEQYREAARGLMAEGVAYGCFCSPAELEARRQDAAAAGRPPGYDGRCRSLTDGQRAAFEAEGRRAAVRFRVPPGSSVVADLVHRETVFDHADIVDFVILRADETPTYLLAAAYDDIAMRITHVIRGEDLLPSTPRQAMIYEALGAPRDSWPVFAHLPLIVGPDRKPLSKRFGDVSVEYYRDRGFLPEALVNYLALLGWSPGDGVTERFTRDELVGAFDLPGVSRNPAAFDAAKLAALNGEKIRALEPADCAARIEAFLVREDVLSPQPSAAERDLVRRAVPLIQERLATLDEAPGQLAFLFADVEPDERAASAIAAAQTLPEALSVLEAVGEWTAHALGEALQSWADGAGLKRKVAFQPLRAAVTGRLVSPPLFESLELLGRERSLARVRRASSSTVGG